MRLLIILLIFYRFVSAYELNPVQGIEGRVQAVNFDSLGNIYAVTNKIGDAILHLSKVSPANELLWTIDLPLASSVHKILITSQGDVYLFLISTRSILAVLRSNSTDLEEIDSFSTSFSYLDAEDNLLYCRETGVYFLQPGLTTPILVENLENYYVKWDETTVVDSNGNIYVVVTNDGYIDSIALISLQEAPQATLFNISNADTEFVFHLIMDRRDNVWILMSDRTDAVGYVKKIANGTVDTIRIEPSYPDLVGAYAKDKIFVLRSRYYFESSPGIYYITLDNEIVEIMTNFTVEDNFQAFAVAGKDGSVYFRSYDEFTPELGSIIGFRPEEVEPFPVLLDDSESRAVYMATDCNDDLWILTDWSDIYIFNKNETKAERISNFNETCDGIEFNLVTKKAYFSCYTGLYFTDE